MVFTLGSFYIEKFIQFDRCKGHLNKALIDKKTCIYLLFIWNWLDERIFFLNSSSKLKPGANKINIAIINNPL